MTVCCPFTNALVGAYNRTEISIEAVETAIVCRMLRLSCRQLIGSAGGPRCIQVVQVCVLQVA
jgi:hypothetical protein